MKIYVNIQYVYNEGSLDAFEVGFKIRAIRFHLKRLCVLEKLNGCIKQ